MELNDNQRQFLAIYKEGELAGNSTKCYAQAYSVDSSTDKGCQSAKANSSRLLRKLKDAGDLDEEPEPAETDIELQDETEENEQQRPVEILCIC